MIDGLIDDRLMDESDRELVATRWFDHVLSGEPETVWIPRGEGDEGGGIR